ncbi:hypothetical protein [Deinococcus wulumuqiensis]|uniref:Uncharacterized protein n=1 Tax=Deinococcus wulumuqiensis TaxID=980427 RepID=A0AAV4K2H4_9DEIO|nr:hypothetical protein [Deinococcus wulumuqiensis]QII20660.1 hypothetical protein G6R31_07720 [Deinococcus wulumuqiensis R12]GGI73223.1 hypothetical protein GCM10010914_03980 [Deinococcus wulumuqiensis]GGP28622.1 hypothetical protein GCM10008021_02730 [Deinococcus wulumuqiensis]
MRPFLPLLLLGSLASAAQVTLREGQTGTLGSRQLQVLEVQDRRCGPTENCPADVMARVRVRQGNRTTLLTLSFPPERVPRWSGVGVVGVSSGRVMLTDQPPGSGRAGHRLTLKRGESGRLGPREITLLGTETRTCPPTLLCVRPKVTQVYLNVRWGKQKSWLALESPPPASPKGIRLTQATAGPRPALTFSDLPQ